MGSQAMTICWHCQNAVPDLDGRRGCPWSRSFQPVPGWDAARTDLMAYRGVGKWISLGSYLVRSCPLYVSDAPRTSLVPKRVCDICGAPLAKGRSCYCSATCAAKGHQKRRQERLARR